MGSYRASHWATELAGLGLPRRDIASGGYRAYIPDRLAGHPLEIAGDIAADISDATAALSRLDAGASGLTNTETLARLLLRAESIGSSYIEGLEISPVRLLRADFARAEGSEPADATANEVLANVDAMMYAVEHACEPLTLTGIKAIHRRLLGRTRLRDIAGVFRTKQNWIGGSEYDPLNADFIPPPPHVVEELLDDLCRFANDDVLPAIAQAALTHSQFEMIHPFADGNGRTGRALIHMVLQRRGLATRVLPPISLVLATQSKAYRACLQGLPNDGPFDAADACDARDRWMGFFAASTTRAVADATAFADRIAKIQSGWSERLSANRTHSGARALLGHLPSTPILTVQTATTLLKRSIPAAAQAVNTLVDAGILHAISDRKRDRIFEAREVIDAFVDLERALASPAADTRMERPARPTPRRVRR